MALPGVRAKGAGRRRGGRARVIKPIRKWAARKKRRADDRKETDRD